MQDLTPEARQRAAEIASQQGVSADAAETLLRALAYSGGSQAQFSHPELGGMGQWQSGGMIMIGDMFNNGLKARVDALCLALAQVVRGGAVFVPAPAGSTGGWGGDWWPAELGSPASSGAQNDMAYAYFPGPARLAVKTGETVKLYDTTGISIFGVSQQQGGGQTVSFSTDRGTLTTFQLPLIGG
jgi:hypothetical protein